ncbi:peptidase M28 [Candidatus Moduliflexus flocculans]|uniref:Peptidase M28 n=1 Tax=Candidatus Moduliflexus flocculans TaxID=1499966 RepID=A0A0S6VTN4_9BACT|nr:peptidase M28 [Candidatus Moduliflexus flocculans]
MTSKYVADTLRFLCQQPRSAGSVWNAAAREFLTAEFRAMGYAVRLQEFPFTGWELLEAPRGVFLTPKSRPFEACLPVVWSGATPGEIEGVIQPGAAGLPDYIATFEAYYWELFPVVNEHGVAACLLGNHTIWPQSRDDASDPTPYLMIGADDWMFLRVALHRKQTVRVRLSVNSRYLPGQKIANIIAQRGETPSALITAHYDSFFNTVGAHDNASGVAALLCAARRLAESPLADQVAFVAFDAEEWNKFGAYRFVEEAERSKELQRIKAVINIDSVGVGDRIAHFDDPEMLTPFDAYPFAQKGIHAVQITSTGDQPFAHWHQPGDNLAIISDAGYKLIGKTARIVERLCRHQPQHKSQIP